MDAVEQQSGPLTPDNKASMQALVKRITVRRSCKLSLVHRHSGHTTRVLLGRIALTLSSASVCLFGACAVVKEPQRFCVGCVGCCQEESSMTSSP